MFAYVHFESECERHSDKDIVEVSTIQHFDPNNWKKNKYYKIKCGPSKCKGIVIFVQDTIEDLRKMMIIKRAIVPPKNKMSAAEESTDMDESNITAKRKDKSEDINKVLQEKICRIQLYKADERNVQKKENLQPISKNGTCYKRSNNKIEVSRDIKKPHLSSNEIFEGSVLIERNKKCQEECNNSSHSNIENEIKILKARIVERDRKIEDQSRMIQEMTNLNMQLQKSIISYFEEFRANAKQLDEFRSREGLDAPVVGFKRKEDKTIHLGRNVWISKAAFDGAFGNARWTNAMRVKNLAVAVFGLKTLQSSSITGNTSNRFKDKKPKPPLDKIKLLAIQDIYLHWLKTV
ncbi:PREDICTED: uncharacterized protein LOC105448124 [Wasmannia auropunctata]|uniref:uncharacterized protein LOC105448124 n=1 Tax=Wasmannia auropunctata TaxID=64793 RepID=UPI0005EE443D|nr:PREDICTED: uncharacterized protein LOC105448124 [Wasmannia auropunctata]